MLYAITDEQGNIIEEYGTLKEAREDKKKFIKEDAEAWVKQTYILCFVSHKEDNTVWIESTI